MSANPSPRPAENNYLISPDDAPVGVLVFSPAASCTYVNPRAAAMLGFRQQELRGLNFLDLFVPGDDFSAKRWLGELARGRKVSGEAELLSKEQGPVSVELSATVREGGEIEVLVYDITRLREAEYETRRSASLVQATLDSTADGILVVDREGRIVSYNKKFAAMWAIPEAILESRDDNVALAFVLDQLREPWVFLQKVRDLYVHPSESSYDVLEFKDGRVFERFSQAQTVGGEMVGRVWSFRDVTSVRRALEGLRSSEENYRQLIESSQDCICHLATDGTFLSINYAGCHLYGYPDQKDVIGRDSTEKIVENRESARAAIERAATGETVSLQYKSVGSQGREIWSHSTIAPIRDPDGTIKSLIRVSRDMTDRVTAERRLARLAEESRLLLEVSETATSSLRLVEIMSRLTRVAADLTEIGRCSVLLCVKGRDPRLAIAASTQEGLVGHSVEGDIGALPISPVVERNVAADRPAYVAIPPEDMNSALVIPLVEAGQTRGAMILDQPGMTYEFSSRQHRLAEAIGRQASVAIQNAHAFELQLNIAATLQQNFFPEPLEELRGVQIGFTYTSATEGALVGGDFFDYFALGDGRIAVAIGDVSGKGLEATLNTAAVKYATRALAALDPSPSTVLEAVNQSLLAQIDRGRFVTMFYAVVDPATGRTEYSSAGHPPAIFRRSGGHCEVGNVAGHGFALGVFEDARYETSEGLIGQGDMMILYTDGLTEARSSVGPRDMFGLPRVCDVFSENVDLSAKGWVERLYEAVWEYTGGDFTDDLGVLAVKL